MPQRPDGMTITDTAGQELYAGIFDTFDRRKDATVMRSNIQRGWENNAIGVWENEGGASGTDSANHQYGRRVEMDRSWTVYNVFSGAPANTSGNSMTGLSQSDATDGMLSLNLRSERRQRARDKPLTRKAKDH
jgi:hypothetical protein